MTRDESIALVIDIEGGLVDNPADPGGRTNMGVTQKYLNARNHSRIIIGGLAFPDMPAIVDDLTPAQVTWLYQTDQWRAVRGDDIPAPLATLAFDAAVNQGPEHAIELLQQSVGLTPDGSMGPITIQRVNQGNPLAIAKEYAARRGARYAAGKPVFELGWMRRLFTVYTAAIRQEPAP